jgi:hypothetical protein
LCAQQRKHGCAIVTSTAPPASTLPSLPRSLTPATPQRDSDQAVPPTPLKTNSTPRGQASASRARSGSRSTKPTE